ncbi:S8 family peptidase [Fibrobacterota bacterium]
MIKTKAGLFSIFFFLCHCIEVFGFTGPADFIITLKRSFRDSGSFEKLRKDYLLTPKYEKALHGMMPVRVPLGLGHSTARQLLESDRRIAHVEPDYLVHAQEMPNDPLFDKQWSLYNPANDRTDVNAVEAWKIHNGDGGIVIAILDTGIDYYHPDLADNLWENPGEAPSNGRDDDGNGFIDDVRGWDFSGNTNDPMDRHFHGTMMAGVAGAVTDNNIGIAGMMPKVSLMPVKGLSDRGSGNSSDLIAAIYYAVDNGADIINASWGGGGFLFAMQEAIEYAADRNVIFVAAAGNYRRDNDERPFYPASYPSDNIVSVGASTRQDSIASFSHVGKESVDLFAPGVDIISTFLNGGYMANNGTSLSAPLVAGCLGLLASISPEATYQSYLKVLFSQVKKLPHMRKYCVSGGRLDAHALLRKRGTLFKTVETSKHYRSILYVLTQILKKEEGGR